MALTQAYVGFIDATMCPMIDHILSITPNPDEPVHDPLNPEYAPIAACEMWGASGEFETRWLALARARS